MKFSVHYDQYFAIENGLTLVEVNCLAACFTLVTWSKGLNIDGESWFWYSEAKMVEEFPLLFGNEKRVYKNMKILADKGFIELSNVGRKKVLKFTDKCIDWNSTKKTKQTENGLKQTENGLKQTENGLKQTENGLKQTENGLKPIYMYDKDTNDKETTDKNTKDKGEEESFAFQEKPDGFSIQPHAPKKTSELLGINADSEISAKALNTVDAFFPKLVLPFDSEDFLRLFFILCCQPKWRNKTISAIQMNLNKIAHFEKDFALRLIESSIAGGWQGLVFSDTEKKYEEWKKNKSRTFGSGINYADIGKQMTAEEAEKYLDFVNNVI